ncbi:phosphatase PAP2 family protein [Microbacterium aurantiacum]|uniref:phosphatase PAP2 family protein n=1 Tax=Microbacterium aurantiacum TaxID=162393 RepID=UPI001F1A375E|nr:phosphatase PAP2 family protein [Microbacterium aurantiacum]
MSNGSKDGEVNVEAERVAARARVSWIILGAVMVAAAVGLGAWTFARGNAPFAIDLWWNDLLVALASPVFVAVSQAMDFLGGGWFGVFVVPIGGAVALWFFGRRWGAVFFLAASILSAGTVQLLKQTFGRERPEQILVVADYGSFPSGHVANAATIAAVALVLFPRLWVILVGAAWVLLMAFSRTAVHAHWLSDTLAGILVGVGVVLVLAGAMARPLAREIPEDEPDADAGAGSGGATERAR